jgi:hypothetical protein
MRPLPSPESQQMNFNNEENLDVKILKIQENFLLSTSPIPQPRSEAQEPTPNIYTHPLTEIQI